MVQKLENSSHLLENRNEEITRKKWCWLTDSQHAKKLPPAAAVREGLPGGGADFPLSGITEICVWRLLGDCSLHEIHCIKKEN